MNDRVAVPIWFWVVGILLLLWGCAGIFFFYTQMTTPYDEMVAAMGKPAADCIAKMPPWLWWVYGTAVWSGTAGSAALLLRRGWALPLYLISLVSVIVQFGYSFGIARTQDILGWSSAAFPAFIIAMAVFEVWFASYAKKRALIV